ncbi:MAG: DUF1343 domain-containing protein [Candidatus Riflebacteria bacterium]|nr:DUF1343 domain-containing protein [Candidatus Riflebacteria bacterium]
MKKLKRINLILFFSLFILSPNIVFSQISALKLGIDVLLDDHSELVKDKKIALLISPTSFNFDLEHSIDSLSRISKIKAIFTGDKFFRSTFSDASQSEKIDAMTNAPVFEITDPLKKPSIEEIGESQILVIDVQDVGIRFFNYVTLLAQFLELARDIDIPVIVLDRPNPINGLLVSGPVLELPFRSRFGVYPIPLVYGMTFGELALYFNKVFGLGAKLTVIGMEGYQREMSYRETAIHWVPPSDHLPEPESPAFYAITGILGEMGIFSTGVGTTRPFHYILAPWIDGELVAHNLTGYHLKGVRFLSVNVTPYYGLYERKKVGGIEIIIDDFVNFDPAVIGLAILRVLYKIYPDKIPLDNQSLSKGFDTLLGGAAVREAIIKQVPLNDIILSWTPKIQEFLERRKNFLIYKE